jgi:hypothetical protein
VGSGLAGLTAAYLLTKQTPENNDVEFDLHLFEKVWRGFCSTQLVANIRKIGFYAWNGFIFRFFTSRWTGKVVEGRRAYAIFSRRCDLLCLLRVDFAYLLFFIKAIIVSLSRYTNGSESHFMKQTSHIPSLFYPPPLRPNTDKSTRL